MAAATGLEDFGRALFESKSLSADGRIACASCHRPELAFTDGKAVATGVDGRAGTRNTPSLLDVATQRALFWDGRRDSLEGQAPDPLLNASEHGLADEADVLAHVRADPALSTAYAATYGVPATRATMPQLTAALAAFERGLVAPAGPFDRFIAGDAAALDPAARRGWAIFSGEAQCTRCHAGPQGGARAVFTDHGFHSLGVGMRRIERDLPDLTRQVVDARSTSGAWPARAAVAALLADPGIAALGRFVVTLDPADIGHFKTPGLRNVAVTAPYMHDGSVATLREAVDLEVYYRGNAQGQPLILTPAEREDLLAFLRGLTSDGLGQPMGATAQSARADGEVRIEPGR